MGVEGSGVTARIQQMGVGSVPLHDLLAVVLSRTEEDVPFREDPAAELVRRYPGRRIVDLSQSELHAIAGFEPFESLRVVAAIEIGRRAGQSRLQTIESVEGVEDAFKLFAWLAHESQENFCAAFLNSKGGIISTKVIHIGTLNMSVVGAREVFREAVRENAASVIVAHNHPSGDPTPSEEDIAITEKLREAGDLLDIRLLDHVVIGSNRCVSLMREGLV